MSHDIVKSVANDTLNGSVDLPRLEQEITNSPQIATVLVGRAVDGDVLTLTFADIPPQDEKNYVDSLVAAHSGEPLVTEVMSVKLQPSVDPTTHIQIFGAHAFEADLCEEVEVPVEGGEEGETTTEWETEHDTWDYHVFTEDTELQGVSADVTDHKFGDSVTVALQVPIGPDLWLTVATFAVGAYVPHKGRMDVTSEGSSTVMAGWRLAVCYHSTAREGFKAKLLMNYRKWVA